MIEEDFSPCPCGCRQGMRDDLNTCGCWEGRARFLQRSLNPEGILIEVYAAGRRYGWLRMGVTPEFCRDAFLDVAAWVNEQAAEALRKQGLAGRPLQVVIGSALRPYLSARAVADHLATSLTWIDGSNHSELAS